MLQVVRYVNRITDTTQCTLIAVARGATISTVLQLNDLFTEQQYQNQAFTQTSVPTLKRNDGSANILFRSIAHDLIAVPSKADPYIHEKTTCQSKIQSK